MVWVAVFFSLCNLWAYDVTVNNVNFNLGGIDLVRESYFVNLSDTVQFDQVRQVQNWKKTKKVGVRQESPRESVWLKFYWPKELEYGLITPASHDIDRFEVYINGEELRKVSDRGIVVTDKDFEQNPTVYVRVKMDEGFNIPLMLFDLQSYYHSKIVHNFVLGGYLGVMVSVILLILILFFSIRSRIYGFYLIYLIAVFGTQLSIFHGFRLTDSPAWIWLNEHDVYIFSSLLGMAFIPFVLRFMRVRKHSRILLYILHGFGVCYGITLFLSITSYLWFCMKVLMMLNLLGSVFLLVLAALLLRKERNAKYFLLAWSPFLLGVSLFILENLGLVYVGGEANRMMLEGNILECVLFSVFLGADYHRVKKNLRRSLYDLQVKEGLINKLKVDKVDAELKYFASRIQPHFVFNLLTSIKSYFVSGRHSQLLLAIDRSARLIRDTLEQGDLQLISLEEEKDYILNYLNLSKLLNDIEYQFFMTPGKAQNWYIPPFLVQPLVENCVKHAFHQKTNTSTISIRFEVDETLGLVEIYVSDNGCGMRSRPGVKHQSVGIMNLRRRLKLINIKQLDVEARFEILATGPLGTDVRLTLPLTKINGN